MSSAAAVLLSALLLLCVSRRVRTEVNGGTEEFDVKPGGLDYTFTRSWGDLTCSFSYAAQGGTNEKWQMSFEVDDTSGYFSCLIHRPLGTSYLYFMKFKAEVSGGKIESCEAYSQADKPLKESEYEIKDRSVSCVPGLFSSSLSKLKIVVQKTHGEL